MIYVGMPPPCACGVNHQSWRAMAACRWPRMVWIKGEGRFATLSFCPREGRRSGTVTLHGGLREAWASKRSFDGGGCGGRCAGRHFIIDLAKGART